MRDPIHDTAIKLVSETRRATISHLKRKLKIGFKRASSIIQDLETEGIISIASKNGSRDVLIAPPQYLSSSNEETKRKLEPIPESVVKGESDSLYDEVVNFVCLTRRVSISSLVRKFKISYERSEYLINQMEQRGIVGPAGASGAREILAPAP